MQLKQRISSLESLIMPNKKVESKPYDLSVLSVDELRQIQKYIERLPEDVDEIIVEQYLSIAEFQDLKSLLDKANININDLAV